MTKKISQYPAQTSFIIIFYIFYALMQPAQSQENGKLKIAAIVNDKVISILDLNKRLHLITVLSPAQIKGEIDKQLARQILNQLIGEELEKQEIERLKIKIGENELSNAKRLMEQRFKLKLNTLDEFIKERKIDKNDVISQIKISLGWTKVIQRKYKNYLKITDEEIDEVINKLIENIGKTQYRISEIFLPIDEENNESDTRHLISKLYESIKADGNFRKIARDFSATASAANSGQAGWVVKGQLLRELDVPMRKLKKGAITPPIQTVSGFHIIKLEDKRVFEKFNTMSIKVNLIQTLIPILQTDNYKNYSQQVRQINRDIASVNTCEEMIKLSKTNKSFLTNSLGNFFVQELSPYLKSIAISSKLGVPNKPQKLKDQISIITVCRRTQPKSNIPTRISVERKLQGKKIETMARKYLRDLRRNAFIENRL
ncbi:MAG: peptidylprolyl isomerase [Alphaproteobacteria bacterium]|nr:peptidylprolyl isomerase [Alphaproteobacteria bacterium]